MNEDTTVNEILDAEQPVIKHLILPGGGITGLVAYGALQEAHSKGLWKIEDIKSIYATSAGAIIAVILSLNYDWKTVDDYIVKRPWHQICDFNMYALIGAIVKRGIFDITVIREIFSPLFKGLDISLDITLADFYELNKIDIHVFTSELQTFESVNISHKTHPTWTVIEAVYASACLPIFFAPFSKDEKYYADGGLFLNYPLKPCLDQGIDPNGILSVCKRNFKDMQNNLTQEATLFDYILIIFNKILQNVLMLGDNDVHIKNEIVIKCPLISIYDLYAMVSSSEQRLHWIENGKTATGEYIAALHAATS
jgi:NTE family protein